MRSSNTALKRSPAFCVLILAVMTFGAHVQAQTKADAVAAEKPFLEENDDAMSKMMSGMNVKPSGNVDADFVAMMVPHHQGAIDMAQAELRYGTNENLRRIAQEIIVDQQQEIAAMHLALGQPLPPSAPAPDQQKPGAAAHENPSTAGSSVSAQSVQSAQTHPMDKEQP